MTIAIYGNMGNGKNQLALLIAFSVHQKFNWDIYANFHITCPFHENCKGINFLNIDDYLDMGYSAICRVVILDELYQWGADSRRSMDEIARKISNKHLQSRHFNIMLIIIAQVPSSLDKRFREMPRMKFFAMKSSNRAFNYADLSQPEQFFSIPSYWAKDHLWPYYNHREIVEPTFRSDIEK